MITKEKVAKRKETLDKLFKKFNQLRESGKWTEAMEALTKALYYANESLQIAVRDLQKIMNKDIQEEKEERSDKKIIITPRKDTKH